MGWGAVHDMAERSPARPAPSPGAQSKTQIIVPKNGIWRCACGAMAERPRRVPCAASPKPRRIVKNPDHSKLSQIMGLDAVHDMRWPNAPVGSPARPAPSPGPDHSLFQWDFGRRPRTPCVRCPSDHSETMVKPKAPARAHQHPRYVPLQVPRPRRPLVPWPPSRPCHTNRS